MKILHISPKPIFPLIDGGCVAMSQFLQIATNLSDDVHHVAISTPKHPFELKKYGSRISEKIIIENKFINTNFSLVSFFQSLILGQTYHVERFYTKKLADQLETKITKTQFDLIVLESIFTLPYLDLLRKKGVAKIILRTHNVEHLIWSKLAESQKNPFKRFVFNWMSKKLKKYEIKMLPKVDGIACISQEDVTYFQKLGIEVPMNHVPVSFSFEKCIQKDYNNNDFFFIGAMNWKPNLEAVEVLLQTIIPRLLDKDPNIKFHIAGSYMPDWMMDLSSESIIIHGRAENVKDFMTEHGIMLAPMLSGSGVRIKILEAMAYGIPVISTSKGLMGITYQQEKNAICEDNWDGFIQQAIKLRLSQEDRKKIGKSAAEFVQEEYNEIKTTQKLRELIESI
jgi:polysaccharide biosynthesis protein PslH